MAVRSAALQTIAQSTYSPYTFSTLAGQNRDNYGSVDGTGKAAQFYLPSGIAVDAAGSVYVADSWNNTIRKVTVAGIVTTLAGLPQFDQFGPVGGSADGTGSTARFNFPTGVAVDGAGNVYVSDQVNNSIRKITPEGAVTTLAGSAQFDLSGKPVRGSTDGTGNAARFNCPSGLAVDGAGNVYVADSGNNAIRKVTAAGIVRTLAGLAQFDQTGKPMGGSADGIGSAARFDNPSGAAVDMSGNIYVADTWNNTIRKVTQEGVVTTLAGLPQFDKFGPVGGSADGTGSVARFNFPTGVAVDSVGNVYVSESTTIRKITPAGIVTTLAGRADIFGNADGTGSLARFNWPNAVAADSGGRIYVADTLNNSIREGYHAFAILNSGPTFGFTKGQFGFDLTGSATQSTVVEVSTNLVIWIPIWTNTFTSSANFSDPQSSLHSNRFYRAHTP